MNINLKKSLIVKFVGNSAIYTASSLIAKIIPFLLLPLFTTYLSREDYGILGVISSISSFVFIYIGLSPSPFIIVKMPQKSKEEFPKYLGDLIYLTLITFVIVLLGLLLFFNVFKIITIPYLSFIIIAITLSGVFYSFISILQALFRSKKKALSFAVFANLNSFFNIIFSFYLVVFLYLGWKGRYLADFVISGFFAGLAIIYLIKNKYIKFEFSIDRLKEIVTFLFPLTFYLIGITFVVSIDRIFISKMLGLEAVGVYTIACTFGLIIGMIHDSISTAWAPFFYERIHKNDEETNKKLVIFLFGYVLFSIIIYVSFIFMLPFVFHVMVNEKFNQALPVIPIIALGYTFFGLRHLLVGYLYHINKTSIMAFITLVAGLTNCFFNYLLIKLFGLQGAALATTVSFLLVLLMTLFFANKHNKIPWLLK